jgi:RimJ/RimL family protein N-acetyltransferase
MSQDPAIAQWDSVGLTDVRSAVEWLRRGSDWSDGCHATWVIADEADDPVGIFSIVNIDTVHQRTALMSYRTAPWARNRGVATHALRAATGFAFTTMGLERLELYHSIANPASCRVAEKVGYLFEGTQRPGFRDDSGRRWDSHVHARLVGDVVPG